MARSCRAPWRIGVDWTKSWLVLFGGALALAVSSGVDARPGKLESRDDVTFSQAITNQPGNRLRFDRSHSTNYGDAIFGGDSLLLERGGAGSKTTWNHLASDRDLAGVVTMSTSRGLHGGALDELKHPGNHGRHVPPVTAIPEPSTYVLLVTGLAGIVFVMRRHRPAAGAAGREASVRSAEAC